MNKTEILEFSKRGIISSTFIILLLNSYQSLTIYLSLLLFSLLFSVKELLPYLRYNSVKFIFVTQVLCFILMILNIHQSFIIIDIIIYNSTSDVIQYLCGKFFGTYQLTPITTKTMEGYLGGALLTPILFYSFPAYYMKLNLIGMLGGLISSSIKRKIGIKHWSSILGPHGGINDRLDSIIIPILSWFIFF